MILTDTIMIKMEGKNFNFYKNKGYNFNWRDIIEIKIKDVLPNSNYKILAKCDICGVEKKIGYNKYNKNVLRGNFYSCQKCSTIKRKNTCLELFGVDNYVKNEFYIEKKKKTCLEKYGVDNYSKTVEFIDKFKKTCIKKYGVDSYMKTNEFKNKSIKKCLEKYGCQDYSSTTECSEKKKNTRIKNGNQIPDNLLNPFFLYKRKCRNLTYKNKKELFKIWNGYDYYDNELIKDNLLLNYTDSKYPTIDHKITIWYGFINNLPIEEIANINNLCITKRNINSQKNNLNEYEYKKYKQHA